MDWIYTVATSRGVLASPNLKDALKIARRDSNYACILLPSGSLRTFGNVPEELPLDWEEIGIFRDYAGHLITVDYPYSLPFV